MFFLIKFYLLAHINNGEEDERNKKGNLKGMEKCLFRE